MKQEKRRVQRIDLEKPLEAQFGKIAVRIIDLSTTGVRIEHPNPIGGRREADLMFPFEGEELVLTCELVRSRLQRSVIDSSTVIYSSGLRFTEADQQARTLIRALVARLVERRVPEQSRESSPLSVAV